MLLMMMLLVVDIRIVTKTYLPAMEDHLEVLVKMIEDLQTSGRIGQSRAGLKILLLKGKISGSIAVIFLQVVFQFKTKTS